MYCVRIDGNYSNIGEKPVRGDDANEYFVG